MKIKAIGISKFFLASIMGFLLFLISFEAMSWTDLTSRVKNETDLDEKIRTACSKHCQGNRRRGDLTLLKVRRLNSREFSVFSKAYAKNHHHIDPPKIFGQPVGGGAAAYNWTLHVEARGVIYTDSCQLVIQDISVSGDQVGLTNNWVAQQRGKIENIANCTHLLRGL